MSSGLGNGSLVFEYSPSIMEIPELLSGAEEALYYEIKPRCLSLRNGDYQYMPASQENIDFLVNYLIDNRKAFVTSALSAQKQPIPFPEGEIDHFLEKVDIQNGKIIKATIQYWFEPIFSNEVLDANLADFNSNTHGLVEKIIERLTVLEGKSSFGYYPHARDYTISSLVRGEDDYSFLISRKFGLATTFGKEALEMVAERTPRHQLVDVSVNPNSVFFTIRQRMHIKA